MTGLLSMTNLTISLDRGSAWHPAARALSFNMAARGSLCVVGEPGSGKSVTALSIMRLMDENSRRIDGRVALNGKNLLELNDKPLARTYYEPAPGHLAQVGFQ